MKKWLLRNTLTRNKWYRKAIRTLTFALCSTLAFLSKSRLTTSARPWKQARVRAVLRLVSIWALISEPISSNSFTAGTWPFIAANIRGEIPSLLPVLKRKKHYSSHNWMNAWENASVSKRNKTLHWKPNQTFKIHKSRQSPKILAILNWLSETSRVTTSTDYQN